MSNSQELEIGDRRSDFSVSVFSISAFLFQARTRSSRPFLGCTREMNSARFTGFRFPIFQDFRDKHAIADERHRVAQMYPADAFHLGTGGGAQASGLLETGALV